MYLAQSKEEHSLQAVPTPRGFNSTSRLTRTDVAPIARGPCRKDGSLPLASSVIAKSAESDAQLPITFLRSEGDMSIAAFNKSTHSSLTDCDVKRADAPHNNCKDIIPPLERNTWYDIEVNVKRI